MIAPQCIFAYGSSPVKISHKTIPKENTSTCMYQILIAYQAVMVAYTRIDQEYGGKKLAFSETLLLLPFSSSGAIHGRVPRTPPETKVLRLILDNPKSPT